MKGFREPSNALKTRLYRAYHPLLTEIVNMPGLTDQDKGIHGEAAIRTAIAKDSHLAPFKRFHPEVIVRDGGKSVTVNFHPLRPTPAVLKAARGG